MAEQKTKTTSSKSSSILDRITKPSALVKRFLVVVYARTGVGKTTLLGTLGGRGLVVDTARYEGGTEVLADKSDRISVVPVDDWSELDELYESLKRGKLRTEFDWVAVDTITGVQKLARKKVKKESDSIVSQPYTMRIQDYGSMGQLMDIFFAQFRLLPMPVIMLAQERTRGGEDEDRITGPNLSPMALDALAPHAKLMGRLFVYQNDGGKWERRLRVGVHESYYSKVRTVKGRELPDVIRKPNLGDILDYMMGKEVAKPKAAEDETGLLV